MDARPWEREEEQAQRDCEEGLISREECSKIVADIWRDYREAAQEAASEAYERELDRW